MLRLDGLVLTQGTFSLRADLEITPGLTAVIGPSGGGKSTLLAAIAGFLEPSAGAVLWQGKSLAGLAPGARPVSVVFQDNNLFPHLSIAQNTGLALRPDLRLGEAEEALVSQSLAKVGLAGFEDRKPAQLSGGQQSRAALARVLLADRAIVLLDEPFSALGPGLKTEMLALVQTHLVAAGKTVLMITHDPEDAKEHAEHTLLVAEGEAAKPAATGALFADPPDALRRYLGGSD